MTEREVREALAALAAGTKGRGAPEHVEQALLEAFAQRGEHVRHTGTGWKFGLAIAAALMGIVVGVGAWMRVSRVAEPPHPAIAKAPVAVAAAIPPAVEPAQKAELQPVRARRRVRTMPVKRTPQPVREVATQYFPLRYGESAEEATRGPVLRVQVPRVTMASFGLPINQERAGEPIEADVALDETGFARAIRFVRTQ